jgi:hypothetical protein
MAVVTQLLFAVDQCPDCKSKDTTIAILLVLLIFMWMGRE